MSCRQAVGMPWNGRFGRGRAGIQFEWAADTPNGADRGSARGQMRRATDLRAQSP